MQTHESKGSDLRYRLGGARADFVASLGRKIADARTVLLSLESSQKSGHLRQELLRKLTALAQGAKLLRFEAMEQSLAEALAILHRATHEGEIAREDMQFLGQVLEDLPALAWGESPRRTGSADAALAPETPKKEADCYAALVVGSAAVADALNYQDPDGLRFNCEITDDAQAAIDVARAVAPDVIVLDADIPYASELTEALLDDPLTEPVPIIVIGSFPEQGMRESFVAMGATRVLGKPLPQERLRRACEEAIFSKEGRTMRVVLGDPTVQQLGEKLADEVRLALVNAVDESLRGQRVSLGEGTEVLGAIWGAIARVREVVTARTDGLVRFGGTGPEGAIALAPSLDQEGGIGLRGAGHVRGATAADVRLAGRTVLVCDDDPGVVWFISDLLKAAGCIVIEAHDGEQALDLCFRHVPDVVISDILMPKLDGFALARRLKRDVVLRDVPIVLLSWKEDLLQRVRELGAGAAAYMRKESDARAMVSRIREALRAKTRVEARLRGDGEVRGRLDGITVRALLDTVCRTRDWARISVRDASFLYEIEIRDGAPARATRTAGDGSFMNGPRVIANMLGVGAARFIVSPSTATVSPELVGELSQQLARPIAFARAAQTLLSGAELLRVGRVGFDSESLVDYMKATPERVKRILMELDAGASPRELLDAGLTDLGLLEDLLLDLAARGIVSVLEAPKGVDVLAAATDAALKLVDSRARGLIGATPSPMAAATALAIVNAKAKASEAAKPEEAPPTLRDAILEVLNQPSPIPAPTLALLECEEGEEENEGSAGDRTDVEETFFGVSIHEREPASAIESRIGESISVSIRIDEPSSALRSDTPLESVKVRESIPPAKEGKKWSLLFGGAAAIGVCVVALMIGKAKPDASHGAAADNQNGPAQETNAEDATYTDMPAGQRLEPGQGVLEIMHDSKEPIRVDGLDRGVSSDMSLPLWAGNHDVRVGSGDAERARIVEVRSGKIARVHLAQ